MKFQYLLALSGYFGLNINLYEDPYFTGKCSTLKISRCGCVEVEAGFGASSAKWDGDNDGYIIFVGKDKERFWTVNERAFPSNFNFDHLNDEVTHVCWYPVFRNCPNSYSQYPIQRKRQA